MRTTAPPSRRRVEAVDSLAVNRGDMGNDAGSFLHFRRLAEESITKFYAVLSSAVPSYEVTTGEKVRAT